VDGLVVGGQQLQYVSRHGRGCSSEQQRMNATETLSPRRVEQLEAVQQYGTNLVAHQLRYGRLYGRTDGRRLLHCLRGWAGGCE